MAKEKQPTSFRLSIEAIDLADRLADTLGVSKTAVVEMAIRAMAETHFSAPRKKKRTNSKR